MSGTPTLAHLTWAYFSCNLWHSRIPIRSCRAQSPAVGAPAVYFLCFYGFSLKGHLTTASAMPDRARFGPVNWSGFSGGESLRFGARTARRTDSRTDRRFLQESQRPVRRRQIADESSREKTDGLLPAAPSLASA